MPGHFGTKSPKKKIADIIEWHTCSLLIIVSDSIRLRLWVGIFRCEYTREASTHLFYSSKAIYLRASNFHRFYTAVSEAPKVKRIKQSHFGGKYFTLILLFRNLCTWLFCSSHTCQVRAGQTLRVHKSTWNCNNSIWWCVRRQQQVTKNTEQRKKNTSDLNFPAIVQMLFQLASSIRKLLCKLIGLASSVAAAITSQPNVKWCRRRAQTPSNTFLH